MKTYRNLDSEFLIANLMVSNCYRNYHCVMNLYIAVKASAVYVVAITV